MRHRSNSDQNRIRPEAITPDVVKAAVKLGHADLPANHMAPYPRSAPSPDNPAREAAVLIVIYPEGNGLHLVLTRRAEHLRGHSGQISFPGGSKDPEDATFAATALRETNEELGIYPENIKLIGKMTEFYIPPSNFNVHPYVGVMDHKPIFYPHPFEVAEVFSFALHDLLDESRQYDETREFNGYKFSAPYYLVEGHKVWGATAAMLGELEQRLRLALA